MYGTTTSSSCKSDISTKNTSSVQAETAATILNGEYTPCLSIKNAIPSPAATSYTLNMIYVRD